jgi:MoxR-like ATPase
LVALLQTGIAHPGQFALTRRDTQITYLIAFGRTWKATATERRKSYVEDPWAFRDFVQSVEAPSADNQRLALLHLVHPETFEPIVSSAHKQYIVDRFKDEAHADAADVDRALLQIRTAFTPIHGELFSWYASPLVLRWAKDRKAWPLFVGWIDRFRELPDFDDEERTYKIELAASVLAVRKAVEDVDPTWIDSVRGAFRHPLNNLTTFRTHNLFVDWCVNHEREARDILRNLWRDDLDLVAAFDRFCSALPDDVLRTNGERLSIGSFLLLAGGAEQCPPIKISPFRRSWKLARWSEPKEATAPQLYEQALVFLDELVHDSAGAATPLRDRLDAQGAVWALTSYSEQPDGWSPEEWEEFLSYRNAGAPAATDADDEDDEEKVLPAFLDEPTRLRRRFGALRSAWLDDEAEQTQCKAADERRAQARPVIEDMLRELDETRDLRQYAARMVSEPQLPEFMKTGAHLIFVNHIVKATTTEGARAAGEIASAYRSPTGEDGAHTKIDQLVAYVSSLEGLGQYAPGLSPLAASAMWSLQDPDRWAPLWASTERPATTLGWLAPEATQSDRYLAYQQLMSRLDDDRLVGVRVLNWYGGRGLAGVDPCAIERCLQNEQLAKAFEVGEKGYPDEVARSTAECNARRLIGDLRMVSNALVEPVSDAMRRDVASAVPPLTYGAGRPFRQEAFAGWRLKGKSGGLSLRVWVTADGVVVGLYPGFFGTGWYEQAAALVRGSIPEGYEFLRIRMTASRYVLEPSGQDDPGGAFVVGRVLPADDATSPELAAAVADAATVLRPLVDRLVGDRMTGDSEPEQDSQSGPEDIDYVEAAAQDLLVPRSTLDEIVELLRDKRQVILYGPPGTGKTFLAQRLALAICGDDASRTSLVQFHPASSYEDFFEGLRPTITDAGEVFYARTPGPLVLLADRARADPGAHTHVMIIDEINRANLPKVFGELLFLLEYRDKSARTLYRASEPFQLPKNLWFIGTMNTADRSIALIDAAMRRRFHFIPFFPNRAPIDGLLERWLRDKKQPVNVAEFLQKVNAELIDLVGEHLLIGPSHFMKSDLSESSLRRIWDYNIFPLIEEQLWGDRERIDAWRWDAVRSRYAGALSRESASFDSDLDLGEVDVSLESSESEG